MHEDLSRQHDVKTSSNRAFGWTFSIVFLVVAMLPLLSGAAPRNWSLGVSAVFAVVTVVAPALLTVPNRLWMRFGMLLHRIVSPLALGVIFFLVVTPLGLLMRALGKDLLRLRRDPAADSYWIKREPPGPAPDSMPHQF